MGTGGGVVVPHQTAGLGKGAGARGGDGSVAVVAAVHRSTAAFVADIIPHQAAGKGTVAAIGEDVGSVYSAVSNGGTDGSVLVIACNAAGVGIVCAICGLDCAAGDGAAADFASISIPAHDAAGRVACDGYVGQVHLAVTDGTIILTCYYTGPDITTTTTTIIALGDVVLYIDADIFNGAAGRYLIKQAIAAGKLDFGLAAFAGQLAGKIIGQLLSDGVLLVCCQFNNGGCVKKAVLLIIQSAAPRGKQKLSRVRLRKNPPYATGGFCVPVCQMRSLTLALLPTRSRR